MERLSLADQVQQYQNCLIKYKDEIAYVLDIGAGGFNIRYAENRTDEIVPFEQDKFKPIETRLGFINANGAVFQAERIPCRRYHVGLCNKNVLFSISSCDNSRDVNIMHVSTEISLDLTHPAFIKTVNNEYPPFKLALEQAKDLKGAVAFNRQLAIDHSDRAVYRDKVVGRVLKGAKSAMDIVFSKNFAYLTMLTRTL